MKHLTIILLLTSVIFTWGKIAFAQDGAKEKFQEGIAALKQDNFSLALEAFEASYALSPKASVLYNIGMCQKAMFRYIDAKASLKKFLAQAEKSARDAHMVDTVAALEEIDAAIGKIEISAAPSGAAVRIDGLDVGESPLSESVPVNPGNHVVEVVREGYVRHAETLAVAPGKSVKVAVSLEKIPEKVEPPPPKPATVPECTDTTARQAAQNNESHDGRAPVLLFAGISALGLSSAGLAAGIFFTLKWNDEYDKTAALAAACKDNWESSCRSAHAYYSSKLDSDKLGIIIGFSVGGALIAAGTSLVLVHLLGSKKARLAYSVGPAGFAYTF